METLGALVEFLTHRPVTPFVPWLNFLVLVLLVIRLQWSRAENRRQGTRLDQIEADLAQLAELALRKERSHGQR